MYVHELNYRDCPWCGVRTVAMTHHWGQVVAAASGRRRAWGVLSCPRCAGLVILEYISTEPLPPAGIPIQLAYSVDRAVQTPEGQHDGYKVDHLPEDVARFFSDALRVMDAGVPDAAAVQLRRTLEAAAAHKGISERNLVSSLQKMIDQQLVTKDFGAALTHVRKVGNIGAHASDQSLSEVEVSRALRFTTQFLRNVFEVPGELAELAGEGVDGEDGGDAGP